MRKIAFLIPAAMLLAAGSFAQKKGKKNPEPAVADTTKKAAPTPPAKPSVKDKTKSSKKHEGLFTLYQDTATGSVQLYIRKDQLGKEYLYQSFSMGGPTELFLHQNMIRATFPFKVEKSFDKLEFKQMNTNFYYDKNNAVSKAANVDVSDAVIIAEKVVVEDSLGYLIAGDGLLLGDKLDPVKPMLPPGLPPGLVFNLGGLNPGKSKYGIVRSFPNNTDVLVELAYDNPMPFNGGGKDITDARYVRVKLQHSFLELPQNDFRARRDDPRVGYFGSEIDDLTSLSPTPYKDIISRWNLVKKDPNAAISEPVEPIVWWIENTTPVELRPIIKEAGEKWNEAFEAAGFKNAVIMKIMPDDADWDPADIRYNVIRWVSSANPPYGAIGPSFTNPRTGQILGADITVEWRSGAGAVVQDDLFNAGVGTAVSLPWENPEAAIEAATNKPFAVHGMKQHLNCSIAQELGMQFQAGIATIATLDDEERQTAEVRELHKQFLYYLILHEMGHTLGLNHNMKASQMLSPTEVHDLSITRKIGLQGSVMDYPSLNVNSNRAKQGDYYTTKVGPYDIWAIQYGYTPFTAAEEETELRKILSRSTDPQLTFGNDADDMRAPGKAIDPRVMVNDMSNDMVAYAEDRLKLVNTMLPKLQARFVKPDQSYAELRTRYYQLMGQRAQMLNSVSRYIGGVYVDRSFPGQKTNTKPFTPVPVAYQKKAMALLNTYLFAPNAFAADAPLFPYLQMQRRGFGFFNGTEDIKPQNTFAGLQLNTLAHILHPVTLSRINNSGLYGNTYSVAEVMSDLSKSIFQADLNGSVNLYRQNLQTEFVKGAAAIVEAKAGYDNASKAAALHTLKKVKALLAGATSPDEQTRAHRANLVFLIDKAISVK
ncbi:zinc-dependent metalloprotease [Flavihumibacter sp. CACIAM 22H1]|uniref:zinc-dependent metalloprotease n=1 Tax=Flavihumibacter sp. CACIAM 22H1 TaxID=1812911 RepID=UPI0007A84FB3|nr:zinc-dependent metalloprotease [Flavihumibacter sp. CACIAM 22H1]KYP15637.1 MAG: Matrixin [Flavihumibacter sp. CACIAM 22H1]